MIFLNIVIMCVMFALLAYLGTGTDAKNIKGFRNYPEKVKERVRKNPDLAPLIKESPMWAVWMSNLLTFTVILFVLGLDMRTDSFWLNFLYINIVGQTFNLFDLAVIDFLWWRNSKRPVLSGTEDLRKEYLDMHSHVMSFLRAIPMFLVIGAIDGFLLTLF